MGPGRRTLVGLVIGVTALPALTLSASAQARPVGDIQVFTRIGAPGHPDALAVAADGSVWVGTNGGAMNTPEPSALFHYSAAGTLIDTVTVTGQDRSADHGLLAITFDSIGRLYVVDRAPARVLRVDPVTGAQTTYAEIPDLPTCGTAPCEPGPDQSPWPNGATFGADGSLYVADFAQATIFRIPRGGGSAEVWLQDDRFISPFGLNSLAFDSSERLLFTTTAELVPGAGTGGLRRVTLNPDGSPGPIEDLYDARPGEGPDGLAVAASGQVYLTTLITNQMIVLSPAGEERARYPATAADNLALEVPLDNPASIRFAGTRLLLTNLSFFRSDPDSYAVLDIEVGEPGLRLHEPAVDAAPTGPTPSPSSESTSTPPAAAPLAATGGLPYAAVALLVLVVAGAARRT